MKKHLVWICFILPFFVQAQNEDREKVEIGTFKAGLIFGINAAQVHGDAIWGYNKLVLVGGGRVAVRFKPNWEGSVEMLYSQRGSTNDISSGQGLPRTKYKLNYAEIPLIYSYVDKGIRISAGLSYGRLVGFEIINADVDQTDLYSPFYRKNDFSILASGGYFINDNWGFEVRWSRSFISIVDNSNLTAEPQFNVWLSFRSLYMF